MPHTNSLEKTLGFTLATGCPELLYQIMCDCWRLQPEDRPTFESLQWRLEDFFVNSDGGQYNEADNVLN